MCPPSEGTGKKPPGAFSFGTNAETPNPVPGPITRIAAFFCTSPLSVIWIFFSSGIRGTAKACATKSLIRVTF